MTTLKVITLLSVGMFVTSLGATRTARAAESQPRYIAKLSVKHMCCAKESVPAIKELSKVQGIARVNVDYKAKLLLIEVTSADPSRRAIWEAAERVKIEPYRLATPEGVYSSKPQR